MSTASNTPLSGIESIRVLLLLAKFPDDSEPWVVGCMDQTVWENIDQEEEDRWRASCRERAGGFNELEFREVWATFAPDDLAAPFRTPDVVGAVE